VHDPSAARETGVVVSAKQNYGFIKCAEREHKQVFFHFSEVVGVRDPAQIQPGLEVLFSLSTTASGRVVATRVQTLPPGTISFFTIESSVREQSVARALR
jgi:cold shock CspA family protein